MKTRPRAPEGVLSVNLLTADPLLTARLRSFGRRAPRLRLRASTRPLPDCDAYLFPAEALPGEGELEALQAGGAAVLAFGPPALLRAAFLAGCDDFLKDPWSPEELECRLEHLAVFRQRPGAVSAGFPWGELSLRGARARSPYGEASLSYPESRILAALLSRPGEVVSREVLAYAAWGRPLAAGSRALDAHVAGLRRKLRRLAPPGGVCLRALRGVGYLLG